MSLSFLRKAFIGYAVVLVIAVFCDALRYGWIAMINIPEYIENAVGLGLVVAGITVLWWEEFCNPMHRFAKDKEINEEEGKID